MNDGLLNAARRWQEARNAEASAGIDDRVDKIKAADLQKVHFQRMLRLTPSRAVADLLTQLEERATAAELEASRLRGIELLNEEQCREIIARADPGKVEKPIDASAVEHQTRRHLWSEA